MTPDTQPRFPIYIPSKGRADTALTPGSLQAIGVPFRIVVEPSEEDAYRARWGDSVILLDMDYKKQFDMYWDFPEGTSTGSGPARNFIWDHSISEGHAWHWIMDDNIDMFGRLHKNTRRPVGDGSMWWAMEDFCLRYENVAMAGPTYSVFAPSKNKLPPFFLNSRIYSCNLIRNDVPFRWRGRYNEDTDLSLRMLKAGWCTVLFNAFLQYKISTQVMGGGNTQEFYSAEGTLPKSQMLVDQHPDVARLSWRYDRYHHYVDYNHFKHGLIRKADWEPPKENPYKMELAPSTYQQGWRKALG
jgi:hypothetical protein